MRKLLSLSLLALAIVSAQQRTYDLLRSPEFRSQLLSEQLKRLSQVDPAFAALPSWDQVKLLEDPKFFPPKPAPALGAAGPKLNPYNHSAEQKQIDRYPAFLIPPSQDISREVQQIRQDLALSEFREEMRRHSTRETIRQQDRQLQWLLESNVRRTHGDLGPNSGYERVPPFLLPAPVPHPSVEPQNGSSVYPLPRP